MSKIYTKTGDSGTTSLYNGQRVPKNHKRIVCVGTLDELSAHLGLFASHCLLQELSSNTKDELLLINYVREIQSRLLDIGSAVATPLLVLCKW